MAEGFTKFTHHWGLVLEWVVAEAVVEAVVVVEVEAEAEVEVQVVAGVEVGSQLE